MWQSNRGTDRCEYGVGNPDLRQCFSTGDALEEAIASAEVAGLT
jgi:predicted RNase H-like HicB family nuclease